MEEKKMEGRIRMTEAERERRRIEDKERKIEQEKKRVELVSESREQLACDLIF